MSVSRIPFEDHLFVDESERERFFQNVDVSEYGPLEQVCWNWTGTQNDWGYGRYYQRGRFLYPHRVSALNYYEEDAPEVRHLCGNRLCVNPLHLALGTRQDNVNDRKRDGGYANMFREPLPNRDQRILEFRADGMKIADIAEGMNLAHNTVRNVIRLHSGERR